MYILIDREQMCVRYKHNSGAVIANLVHIEMSNTRAFSGPCDQESTYEVFTDYELKILHENICGQKFNGYGREALVNAIFQLCKSLEPCKINGFEVALQAAVIKEDDDSFYRYVYGKNQPLLLEEPYIPTALTSVPGFTPIQRSTPITQSAPAVFKPMASTITPRSGAPSSNEAPKSGSKTGRVWEIADAILEQYPARPTDFKTLRGKIITACEAEGINSSTASVQYGKWRHTKT
jgi:hypothetical protein